MQLPLTPDVGLQRWHYFALRANDARFEPIAKKVWERDDYTCRYCSFRGLEHLHVVNANRNYQDNRLENLVTACPLCSQALFIEHVGKHDQSGGQLIYLPEMTQNDLNGLCHALFCAMALKSTTQDIALHLYDALKLRSQAIEKKWGEGLSKPHFMGQMLIDTPACNTDDLRRTILKDLRLLPNYDSFSDIIKTWIKSSANRGR